MLTSNLIGKWGARARTVQSPSQSWRKASLRHGHGTRRQLGPVERGTPSLLALDLTYPHLPLQ